MWYLFFLLPVAVIVWILYEWLEHSLIRYTTTEVESQKLPEEQKIKVCLITDLHNNRKNIPVIMENIRRFSPDMILLSGDMVDKHNEKNRNALKFIRALSEIAAVYYSIGNHEESLKSKQPEHWETYFQNLKYPVHLLDNQGVFSDKSDTLFVSGLSLPKIYYKKGTLYESTDQLPKIDIPEHRFHIMLAHNPEYVSMYSVYDADLILSGHLHGGLLRLPWIGGVISPRLRFSDRDSGLVLLENGSYMYISRGLGSHTIPLRFFNRVEINFLVLTGTGDKNTLNIKEME